MSDPFIGEIKFFGFNWAPRNWALCDGQQMAVSQQQSLFALIGNTYGGNGTTDFNLPDLRGRVPMHFGQGPGTGYHPIGERGGYETVTLTTAQIPAHNHTATLHGETDLGTTQDPKGNMLAAPSGGIKIYAPPVPADNRAMFGDSITVDQTGGGQAHTNMQPYLVMSACIALVGLWPPRP